MSTMTSLTYYQFCHVAFFLPSIIISSVCNFIFHFCFSFLSIDEFHHDNSYWGWILTFLSAKYCDVDENGIRHMAFCRVIMGRMEHVHPGSRQFHPRSEEFDSGVDDIQNPTHYVVWTMNVNTHIYPEYVISFKLPPDAEGDTLLPKSFLFVMIHFPCQHLFCLCYLYFG